MQINNNKVLVTGGASGIGLGLCERLVKENNTVIACGRRIEPLQQLAEKLPAILIRQCDLENADERTELFEWIADQHADLSVLINNAGIQNWMTVEDDDFINKARKEVAINVEAPMHLTSLFLKLPSLRTVMNVTSGLSFAPLAKVPVYSATKAFMHSFTLSLRYLLAGRNVEVIEIIPPALNTDLGGKGIHNQAPPVSGFIEAIFEQLKQGSQELTFGFSEGMVKAGPEGLKNAFDRMNPAH